jgi:acetyl-CoA synthetase (ADP-forming)
MSATPHRLTVRQILHPRSVAVFGASEDRGKFGGRILHYLMRHRFSGRLVPINPRRDSINGLPCFADIADVDGPVDVAILAVPSATIMKSVEACARAGVGACIIVSTGFAEAGEEGAAVQRRLIDLCRETGMRIIGPNCMGLINPHHALGLTSSLVLDIPEMRRGRVGLISQSGALMVSLFDRAHDAGIGFSACVSLGNQADIEICDILEYMIDDPGTEAIAMYIEGLKDGARFKSLAEQAQAAGKPLLAVKTGRTEAGVKAARSHTASLAGSYQAFEAICHEYGIILMDDPDGMILTAEMLVRFGVPGQGGIGVFSPSGGGAGIGVDRITEAGLAMAALGEGTRQALRSLLLPPQADNPIDLGGRLSPDQPGTAAEIIRVFVSDADLSAVFVMLTTTPRYADTSREIGQALLSCGKPFVVAVTPGHSADQARQALAEIGCPFVDRVDDAIRMLHHYCAPRPATPEPAARPDGLPDPAVIRLPSAPREHEVKALLAAYGVPVARERFCSTPEEALAAAEAIGYPVVLKAVSPDLVHKSDIGAVRLKLTDPDALRGAWTGIAAALAGAPGRPALDGCLVAEMVHAENELIVGLKYDEQFGPMVLVGFGGVSVELVPDTVLASAPVSSRQAEGLLRRLRHWPLLDGYRGRKRADVEAIADLISRTSFLGTDFGGRLSELDINPVLIRSSDGRPVAVDARATVMT